MENHEHKWDEITLADVILLDSLVREHMNSKRHDLDKYKYLNQLRDKLMNKRKHIIAQSK
jgi:hypothetical protein